MKKILFLILTLIVSLALVGCDGGTSKGGSIADENYNVETVENLKAQEFGSVKVSFRIPFGQNIQAIIQEFIDEFETEYPSVDIELDVVSGYDKCKDATVNDIGGGKVPTMTVGYPDHFSEFLISKSIISLDKFIYDANVGYSEDELADFLPDYITENRQFDNKGTFVGLPFNKSTEALFYNKEFFETFADQGIYVPTTWEELEEVCAKIMEIVPTIKNGDYYWLGDIETNLANGNFVPCLIDSGGNLFTTIIHQFGGEYTESIYKSNGLVDIQRGNIKFHTSAKAYEALEYLQGLANKGYINMPDVMELNYGSDGFNEGKAVMNIGSTAGSSYYAESICTTGAALLPYKASEGNKAVIQQGTNVCIFSKSSDLEKLAAWLFIKYMLEPENTIRLAAPTGYMPIRQSAYDLPQYKAFLNGITLQARVHEATTQYAEKGWTFFVDAAWAGSATVRNECETAMIQMLLNKTDISQALQDALGRIG